MKKKLLFTLATLLALATQMSAGPVSKQEALKEAKERAERKQFEENQAL